MNRRRPDWQNRLTFDPEDRIGYFYELLDREVFITGNAPVIGGRLRSNGKVVINQWKNEAGSNYIPVFTSIGRLQRAIHLPSNFLSMQARDLFRILRPAQIIVNPGSRDSIAFSPQERWKIAPQGFWSAKHKPDLEEVPLKRFMVMPIELQEDLRRHFRRIKSVKNAYIQNIEPAQDVKPLVLSLAIDYRGDARRLAEQVNDVVRLSLGPAKPLQLAVNAGDFGPLSEEMYQLFYRRKSSWDLL